MCQQSVVAGVFLWAPHTVSIVVAILFSSHSQCCLFNLHAVCFKSDCQHVHWCVCVSLIVGSLNISGWLWFWKGKVNVFWLCVSVCICVNLFVCPSHVSVVGHGWIRRVTKKKNKTEQNSPPTSFSISPVYALRHSFKWCLTLLCPPPTPHTPNSSQTPHPSTHAHSPHFSMIPSETAACFLPLKRLKTQTVWVPLPHAWRYRSQAARSAFLLSWQHHCSSPRPVFIEMCPVRETDWFQKPARPWTLNVQ